MMVPRTAVFSSLALVMRWNTSCCGTEPKAKAKNAPAMAHQPGASSGRTLNLPSAAAWAIDLAGPPAMSPTSIATRRQADQDDHGLEQVGEGHRPHAAEDGVDQHHRAADHDGVVQSSAPPDSTWITRPSAVICAEVQPR
jgi:hypothetical protein